MGHTLPVKKRKNFVIDLRLTAAVGEAKRRRRDHWWPGEERGRVPLWASEGFLPLGLDACRSCTPPQGTSLANWPMTSRQGPAATGG